MKKKKNVHDIRDKVATNTSERGGIRNAIENFKPSFDVRKFGVDDIFVQRRLCLTVWKRNLKKKMEE